MTSPADPDSALRRDANDVIGIEALSPKPTSQTRVLIDLPIRPSTAVPTLEQE
jgi:hypothetical protein